MSFLEKNRYHLAMAVAGLLFFSGMYDIFIAPPPQFPTGITVTIEKGSSASFVADYFAEKQLVSHSWLLAFLLRLSGKSEELHAGNYYFHSPQNLLAIVVKLIRADYGFEPVRITFPEGITVREMAIRIDKIFPGITASEFRAAAQTHEGYLFPDTYLLDPSSDAASLVALMRANFDTQIAVLSDQIRASTHTLSELVILASILEKEARTDKSRRIIAGILENRLAIGMPLQVDAVFGYIFNRDTYSPSLKDLTIDSPYNTYTHRGLPPGPIGNPGLNALEAALHPIKTKYLYYLTGKDGRMYYATTFAEHQANKTRYLH